MLKKLCPEWPARIAILLSLRYVSVAYLNLDRIRIHMALVTFIDPICLFFKFVLFQITLEQDPIHWTWICNTGPSTHLGWELGEKPVECWTIERVARVSPVVHLVPEPHGVTQVVGSLLIQPSHIVPAHQ
jgi:hypothetical protein